MNIAHLKWPRGDTRTPKITVTDGDGSAIDVSAAAISFTVRLASTLAQTFQKTKAASEISVGGASSNEVTVTVLKTDTAAMTVGSKLYRYDLEITLASGAVITPVSGPITILQDYTYA